MPMPRQLLCVNLNWNSSKRAARLSGIKEKLKAD